MKRLLLSLGLWLGLTTLAAAQCVAVGGVNTVPQTGMNCLSEPSVATYAATGVGIVPAASATDIACLTGSATKTIRVQRIRVSGTAGTIISVPVLVTKHASANTGGTAGTGTQLPVPYTVDTNNVAVTATATSYTANPTIADSSPGIISAAILPLGLTGTAIASPGVLFDYGDLNYAQKPTLRGIAQQVCVNLNGTSPSSGLVNVSFYWTEAAQ